MTDSKELEISKVLTVSSGHVTENTFEALSLDGLVNEIMLPVYSKSAPGNGEGFGLYVYIEPKCLEQGKIPEDLMPLIRLAQENDCSILCLDCDGPELEGYPVYDW